MVINKNKKNFKEEDIKLNYLTEFYPPSQKENKDKIIIINEQKDVSKISQKKYKEDEKEKSEENSKEELEDEVGSIDEFKGANDNRPVLSSYIFTSVHLTENKSIAPSVYTKSDYQELISNYGDITICQGMMDIPS